MQHIKAILFDLDGTLISHIPAGGDVFVEYVRNLGFKISSEDKIRSEHWTHLYFAHSAEIQADGKLYRDEKSFWVNFSRRRLVALGLSSTEAEEIAPKVSAHMAETHHPKSVVPQDAHRLLQMLSARGYILGVASNRDQRFDDLLQELNLASYFQFSFAGAEIKSFKPDRAFFDHMLSLAESAPAETIYIGDNYFADVLGAQRAGITPVLYDPIDLFNGFECRKVRSFGEFASLLK